MTADGPELLALVLALEAEGADEEDVVTSLVEAAHRSATTLMSACTYALSLARDMPYDTTNERTLNLLTRAVQRAVRSSGELHSSDDDPTLLQQIVEVSGQASVAPGAVASRTAEVEADVDMLRAAGDSEEPAAT